MTESELYFNNKDLANIDGEIWESAYGELDGIYEVSNFGRVKSLLRVVDKSNGRQMTFPERIMSQVKIKHKNTFSLYVRLTYDIGKCKNYTVASLVLNSFRKPDKYNNTTHHINFCSYDNRLLNLTFENLHNKRQIEYRNGVRDGKKTTAQWFVNGHIDKQKEMFNTMRRNIKGNGKKMFQQAGKKRPVTIFFREKNEVQTFSSIRNAVLLTGMKEYTIRNALTKPKKYVRMAVREGMLQLKDFK